MEIILRIRRYDPESDDAPVFKDYPVRVESTDRILDALLQVKDHLDGSLGLRRSCGHGVCGSDAMLINDRERLACKTLVGEVAEGDSDVITVEPLRHLAVQKDLMVDQSGFFEKYRSVKPFFVARERSCQERERLQSPQDRQRFDDPTNCILCGACYSACPILDENAFVGPAAIVQAARFVFDTRDVGLAPRLDVLDAAEGVWSCENHFECTRVCPRKIKITKNINLTKRLIERAREAGNEDT